VENIKRHIWESGPVFAGFWVQPTWDQFFSSVPQKDDPIWGVYSGHACGTKETSVGGHGVLIIGWGEERIGGRTYEYWLARNSWGKDWAKAGGYLKFRRGVNCDGIETGTGLGTVAMWLKPPSGSEAYELPHCEVSSFQTPYSFSDRRQCISKAELKIKVKCDRAASAQLRVEADGKQVQLSSQQGRDLEFVVSTEDARQLGAAAGQSWRIVLQTLDAEGAELTETDGTYITQPYQYSQYCSDLPHCEVKNINRPYQFIDFRRCLSNLDAEITVECDRDVAGVQLGVFRSADHRGLDLPDRKAGRHHVFTLDTSYTRALGMETAQDYDWRTTVFDADGAEVGGGDGAFSLGALKYTRWC